MRDDRELARSTGLSLSVRAGEIVALAGVDGNGQQELVEAIAGLRTAGVGLASASAAGTSPARAVRAATDAGVAHIAEDRHARGLVLPFTLAENLALREYRAPEFSARGWLRLAFGCASAPQKLLREFDVRGGGPDDATPRRSRAATSRRSCIAREISSDPKVLIAHQPTRGLDVGAIEFVHRRLIEERDKGRAVLLVSLEYEEVRALADRILVIYEGTIAGEFPPDATEEELGIAMTGGQRHASRRVDA